MAKKKKSVNIQYFRVVTTEKNISFNLYNAAKNAHSTLCNLAERTFDRGDKRYSCLKCEDTDDGLLLNISACTPGESVNTIPHPNLDISAEPEIVGAPQNRDFMDGDSFALIHDNHILVCFVRNHPSVLKSYLDALFSESNTDVPDYILSPAASTQALQLLSEGIRSIDVFAATYTAELSLVADAKRNRFSNLLASAIRSEKPLLDATENKNTHAKSTFSVRQSGKIDVTSLTQKEFTNLAKALLEEAETPFAIITKNNSRITLDMLQRKVKVNFDPYGKTIFRNDAWAALRQQKRVWESEGLFN